jgi:C-terminal processing protease CtpA/Prc
LEEKVTATRGFAGQACLGLPLVMPMVLFVALWLGVPWQHAWWLVCAAGIALCALATWHRPKGWPIFSLTAAGYAACAWLILGLAPDDLPAADTVLSAAGAAVAVVAAPSPLKAVAAWLLAGLCLVLLTAGVVSVLSSVWRALRSNLPLQIRPRQLGAGMVKVALSSALFAALLTLGTVLAGEASNLLLAEAFGRLGVQVYTPVRYAREVLATTDYWRGDAATPELTPWWGIPTSGYLGGVAAADSYIAAHVHPADKWSGASAYDAAVDHDLREAQSDSWGIVLAHEPTVENTGAQPLHHARASHDDAPVNLGTIANVAQGSAAALAGVQRGDTLVSIDGEPLLALLARLRENAKAKSAEKNPTLRTFTLKTATTLLVRTQAGQLIHVKNRKTYTSMGVQAVTWHTLGGSAMAPGLRAEMLYLRLNHFAKHTGVHAEAEIRKSAQALRHPNWSDSKQSPDMLLRSSVRTLVIDLRANLGGNVNAVGDLARRLLGKYLQPGLGLPKVQSNDANGLFSEPTVWLEKSSTGAAQASKPSDHSAATDQAGLLRGLQDVVVLTSGNTCSAAELLIHGLKQHLPSSVRFATVGDTTCGKPHGFRSREYFGTTIQVVDTTWLNAAALPAYPQGIAPTCYVKDLILGPEGNDDDVVFQAAVNYVRYGKC